MSHLIQWEKSDMNNRKMTGSHIRYKFTNMKIVMLPPYHLLNHLQPFSDIFLLLPKIWWLLSTSTLWVETSHYEYSALHMTIYTHNHLQNPNTLVTTPSTPPPIGTFHTPSYTLLSYSTPNFSLPNMFLPTPSTSSSPSSTATYTKKSTHIKAPSLP